MVSTTALLGNMMLQTLSPHQTALYDDPGEKFDPPYVIGIFKRRLKFFLVPFVFVGMLGFAFVALQKPIYRSEGEILVEAPEIPPDLVKPTITAVAAQRVEVIQQRILSRDKLAQIITKYNLFPKERASMSGTDLLDLIRSRIDIKPVDLDDEALKRQAIPTIAFTLTFDYENPELAMRVANDLLTEILSEDAASRTNNAVETTKFLEREVKRLQEEHDAVVGKISKAIEAEQKQYQQTTDQDDAKLEEQDSDEVKAQKHDLGALETALAQKSSIYSDEHPVIKSLKRTIADLKEKIAEAPKVAVPDIARIRAPISTRQALTGQDLDSYDVMVLKQQELNVGKSLDDATQKLNAARLGESMERAQQGEHLRVIEQPSLPQKPIRPQKLKWLALAFVLAIVAAVGAVIAVETFDTTIRRSRDLAEIIDSRLVLTIPYLAAPGEKFQEYRNLAILCLGVVAVVVVTVGVFAASGFSMDVAKLGRF
jgi:uncharacterized protein involved in exopolysaccharide biosynthesis